MTRIQLLLLIFFLIVVITPIALPMLLWSGSTRNTILPIRSNYFTLREQFLSAAKEYSEGVLQSYQIAAKGPRGEALSIDTLWLGSEHPKRALVHISGSHGVEGYVGSAIQTAVLRTGVSVPKDSAVIFVHALNPWGMAHHRRVNEDGVDLNRNFLIEKSKFQGAPEAYHAANWFLNPETPPSKLDLFLPQAIWLILKEGYSSMKQAIAGGQYAYPKGIYYGGSALAESNQFLHDFFIKNLSHCEELFALEIHTGLGAWAEDVLFWPYPPGHDKTKRLESLLAESLESDDPNEGVGFKTPGDLQNEIPKLLPNTDVYWLLQEFGAYGPIRTLRTLRNENRYHHYSPMKDLNHWSKLELLESFSPASKDWQSKVLARGVELATNFIGILHETPEA